MFNIFERTQWGRGEADTHVYKELGSRQGKVGVKGPVRRLLLEFWEMALWGQWCGREEMQAGSEPGSELSA